MDRVSTKIAEEVSVLFEDEQFDARPGQEKAEHHAGGATSGYTAPGVVDGLRHGEFRCDDDVISRRFLWSMPAFEKEQ